MHVNDILYPFGLPRILSPKLLILLAFGFLVIILAMNIYRRQHAAGSWSLFKASVPMAVFKYVHFKFRHPKIRQVFLYNDGSGAEITITPKLLKKREQAVFDGYVIRSSEARQNTYVPGWNERDQSSQAFHRTHLIPFNWVLSDNENGLMFTRRDTLNHGTWDHQARAKQLMAMYRLYNYYISNKNIRDIGPVSMDDIEIFASWIIKNYQNQKEVFYYKVQLIKNRPSDIPTAVHISLYNKTHHSKCFDFVLTNNVDWSQIKTTK